MKTEMAGMAEEQMTQREPLSFREDVLPGDPGTVRDIVASTGFFYDHEIEVAVELVDERLSRGLDSGYLFLFAEQGGRTVGYSCYGEIACTAGSYDLYWIAVRQDCRGQGIGKVLLQKTEALIAGLKGRAVWAETSGQNKYAPTRSFYLRNGYQEEAVLKEFYGPGDDKFVYVKRLS
jgi:ribosomal protein S18 acetylase RimI-like enzyme